MSNTLRPPTPFLQKLQERKKHLEKQVQEIENHPGFFPADAARRLWLKMVSSRIHELETIILLWTTYK